ncbi:MAG: hypothetical protein E6647_01495 [Staphylococcus epidermidis]|jgi:hypothetical protein|uniref:Uncharacterized protein n=1 Tax=uncultured Caudovirales phage TaxID=2100421 RepID=A0A2H4JB29_9CAUD|nr:hypothetical protein [Staphylococcus epidermidis]ASN69271.1 hypothetical protein 9S3_19 [uncultured Caudovirales phage]URG13483.1 hypothetical protein CUBEPI14_gp8 [Staphylococcus phage CUB-EPI_14]USL87098.1 hypothetical protein Sazerac_007 [Staphylococcus phage Sazerac]UVD33244.1 hypothetical protein [Staphylococcus phage Lacachita]WGL30787.1 hypothetical protein Southeast_008 [Staphylococcus phage Southeast]WNM55336.1 hypothetical protein CoNPh27_CDS0070 [Staphylococcus phage S-CoN_Ph27]
MFDAKKTIDYFKRTPAYKNKSYANMNDDELESVLFDAYEDIVSLYPSVTVSPRMIVKQMLFKKEADDSGFGMAQRHGLASRKINDASITFSGNYSLFDPYVWQMIQAQLDDRLRGGFGHLV